MTNIQHPTPWDFEYSPYWDENNAEIPHYRVIDANGEFVCETNEDASDQVQKRIVQLVASAPQIRYALTYFFNIMQDYPSSGRKGYVAKAMQLAREALIESNGGAP